MICYTVYGNCQGPVFAQFLNNNPDFKEKYKQIYLRECHLITENEIDVFIDNDVENIDLFIYTPVGDGYRDNYKFSSNYLISHLKPDSKKVVFPSLYCHIYDPQMIHLTDEHGKRIEVPHDYHDKVLIKIFIENRNLTDDAIMQKYLEFINDPKNFNEKEIQDSAQANYAELKRRENLLENDPKNDFVIKVADFIYQNHKYRRLFYSLNHPSKHLYLYMRQQLFGYLGIESTEPDIEPNLDPHSDFIFGIFPPIKKSLELRFGGDALFPSNSISFRQYLEYYRSFDPSSLMKMGMYPIRGSFTFDHGWSVDEKTHRWAESDEATMTIYNKQSESAVFHLLFTIFVIKPQKITIFLNRTFLKTIDFTHEEKSTVFHAEVPLTPGKNILKLSSDSPPLSPGGEDLRQLSFAISEFSVVPGNNLL
jgi:hypothetical protein